MSYYTVLIGTLFVFFYINVSFNINGANIQ
jgi:hypothetical protein